MNPEKRLVENYDVAASNFLEADITG